MGYLQYDTLIFVLFLLTTSLWLRKSSRDRQFRKHAQSHNCQPPPHSTNILPWGIDRIYRLVRLTAQGADVLESIIMPSFRDHGWTFQSSGLFGEESLLTADPENLRAVFATKFNDFVTGDRRAGAFGYMVGKCIFTTDGAFWEHSRALFRPHFATGQINDLEATERAVQDMFQALTVRSGDEKWTRRVDLQTLFLRFTLDTGTEFLFGAKVRSQLAAIPGALPSDSVDQVTRVAADKAGGGMGFTEAFHIASVEVTKRAKLQGLYWLADSKRARRAVTYLQKFIDHLVADTLRHTQQPHVQEDAPPNPHPTLLHALATSTQDPLDLRNQSLFTLVAARDTTAALLTWLFLMLAKHPRTFHTLRATILQDFGPEASSPTTNNITYHTLKKCRHLQHVLSETLRLYPPGPLNSRVAARDTTLPTGGGADGKSPVAVKKGQTVNLCVYAMQRRVDLWGEDALEFKPERWETRRSDWTFLPFSGGPRTCLGQQYALTEAGYLTVRLLQRFDGIEALDDTTHIAQTVTVTLEAKDGANVRLRVAS